MVHHSCYLNNSFEADWLQFGWSWAVCSSIWAALRGGFCEHSVISWLILAGLKPFLRSACRTSTSVPSTTFSLSTSSWAVRGGDLVGGRREYIYIWYRPAAPPPLMVMVPVLVMDFSPAPRGNGTGFFVIIYLRTVSMYLCHLCNLSNLCIYVSM